MISNPNEHPTHYRYTFAEHHHQESLLRSSAVQDSLISVLMCYYFLFYPFASVILLKWLAPFHNIDRTKNFQLYYDVKMMSSVLKVSYYYNCIFLSEEKAISKTLWLLFWRTREFWRQWIPRIDLRKRWNFLFFFFIEFICILHEIRTFFFLEQQWKKQTLKNINSVIEIFK